MDNFTRFPNDILEGIISCRFSGVQLTVILYIIRKVNGWGKTSDAISISRLAKDTGYTRRTVVGAVHDLELIGVISIERNSIGSLSKMHVNDPETWSKSVNKNSHVNENSQGTKIHTTENKNSHSPENKNSHLPVNENSHTKERKISKDTSQKKEYSPPPQLTKEEQERLYPASEGWTW